MRILYKLLFIIAICFSLSQIVAQNKYKCMVQMTNYDGEAAYIVVSLINPQGQYEKTLYMMGDDSEWYDSLKEWFSFFKKKSTNIDAITGASITGGNRQTIMLNLDDKLLDKGYKIRFESVVEDQKYYTTDAEVPFSSQEITAKTEGKGYIRYVKFSKAK